MKIDTLLIIFGLLLIFKKVNSLKEGNENIIMNFYYSENNRSYNANISNKRDENAIASAVYNKTYENIGWDYLAISSYQKTDNRYNDSIKAYGMGYLEGVLTKNRIFSHYTNFKNYFLSEYKDNYEFVKKLFFGFYENNFEYMEKKSLENMNQSISWEHVYYICQQMKGLYNGYNNTSGPEEKIDFSEFLVLSGIADAIDIKNHLFNSIKFKTMTREEIDRFVFLSSHCSALVKLAKDSSDIWFGHNTWNYYILMIRIFKEYRFVTNKGTEKSKTMVFSSYPGALSSIDEFYYLDSNLLVMGTSNTVLNNELYKLITHQSLLVWVRQIMANRLASSAEKWTELFKMENSGTNNAQFMILDMNKINLKKKTIENKALMIIEQIPEYTETADVTNYLREGYWPSYNVPFINKIYNDSGYKVNKKDGKSENIDYIQSPRAKIFKRDFSNINSNEDFKKFIRYNDYKNDNFSSNISSNSIAGRGDLLNKQSICFGAIDAKFFSVKELLEGKLIAHIISGPTNDKQKTFSFSNNTCSESKNEEKFSHKGVNDVWNFPWIDYKFQLFNKNIPVKDKESSKNNLSIYLIFAGIGAILIIIIIIVIYCLCKNLKNYNELNNNIKNTSFKGSLVKENEEGEQDLA